ncbi:MAG: glycosyltransferase [Chthoniobacterales bacterium]|nr:glycosyltransferase [Chthoniobacterales bacterium]
MRKFSSLQPLASSLVKKNLIKVVTPLTGFLQRIPLGTGGDKQVKKIFYCFLTTPLSFLNWFCQGMLTVAYPSMRYNPIKARQQAASMQWASEFLGIPSAELEKNTRHFLRHVSAPIFSKGETIPTFTVLICFYHHLGFFKKCLDSVASACDKAPEASVEVLVVNDDPTIPTECLLQKVPQELREKVTFCSNKENLGICRSLNVGIEQARGSWILYLDCDDELMPSTFEVLARTIRHHPMSRFISSRALDCDEQGNILLWRLRPEKPSDLLKNNVASHLKVVRKDLHEFIGFFNPAFEGCQDYEFALRASVCEPLCFIPDYLYQYRWHDKSQTVDQSARQNLTAMRIRQIYLLAIFWMRHGTKNVSWNIIGPYAASWKTPLTRFEKEAAPTPKASCTVTFEAMEPYSETRWKLLLIKVARACIDGFREGQTEVELTEELLTGMAAIEGMAEKK